MKNFENAWSFAKAHPFISLWAVQAVVSGIVNATKYLTKPFVKVPEYGLEDVVRAVMKKLEEDKGVEVTDISDETEVVDAPVELTIVEGEE